MLLFRQRVVPLLFHLTVPKQYTQSVIVRLSSPNGLHLSCLHRLDYEARWSLLSHLTHRLRRLLARAALSRVAPLAEERGALDELLPGASVGR